MNNKLFYIIYCFEIGLVGYIIISIFPFFVGMAYGSWRNSPCNQPLERIEYIMPAFRIGCWLGSPPNGDK